MVDRYSAGHLEAACEKALTFTASPSYKSIKNILVAGITKEDTSIAETKPVKNIYGITRGSNYYGGRKND